MELFCIESEFELTASFDSAIIDDDRLLHNLMTTEEHYLINGSYFKCLQTDLKPSMRDIVSNWMLEVCEEERCERDVFPLAMNILDRFLALVKIRKSQLQLLGAVCLLLSSKLRQTSPISPKTLIQYTDFSITYEELTGWEILVLSRLKWDVAAIVPNDFIGPLLRRLGKSCTLINEHESRIKKHALNMIDLCSADFNFSMIPSSMIAAASIITTIDGLLSLPIASADSNSFRILKSLSTKILHHLHEITGIDKELLRECQLQIEQKIGDLKPSSMVESITNVNNVNNVKMVAGSKENYNSALINSTDKCLHPRVFKHAPCVVGEGSIGVEF
ncbi:hypothetical protein RDWZM_006975 [Blomia tropicalis]|uniref:Uncharacterized protein n=1 Tax=Blomia tropicalis TaxID=40697 RepID=A0A9Q0M750_BLOTA|nr:Protein kinase binding [Blomia tropicalis]KAJ6221163.1 hypothetical protein RDWZM_006975 [Blomia tropicalis]